SILSPAAIARMTSASTPAAMADVRGLGWDIDSSLSANRGDLFPIGSFGHTGFTGTSLWMEQQTKSYIVFLSNRVHPDGKGDVTPLRAKLATVVAADLFTADDVARAFQARGYQPREVDSAARGPERTAHIPVLTGIDVLEGEAFARLRGKRVGLLTNQTGGTKAGVSTIDALFAARDVTLVALFSPEHGIRGQLDEKVASSRD